MKSLDERLSSVMSPYDEIDTTQEELMVKQHLIFQKESLIASIGGRTAKIEFDLHLDEVHNQLNQEEFQTFLRDCLSRLTKHYSTNVLENYILRSGLLEQKPDDISHFIEYITSGSWVDTLSFCLPDFDINSLVDYQTISDLITARYSDIKNKIINTEDVNPYFRFYIDNCATKDGVKTLTTLVLSDLPGVISTQLIRVNK